ncbi:hypothetical protein [uncultured Desulfobacter sp.]|uniref:hypothetical protein n=1 Tax=uncultured Desulfobacter sp. TaxID=240139 RepID=UPI0029C9275F|nr:hypothetical protein [uncultured Desulfobacter sp.]
MKVKDLSKDVGKVGRKKQLMREGKESIRDMLSSLFNVIEKFEADDMISGKSDREKIEVLKNIISDMMKDFEQKNIIGGN